MKKGIVRISPDFLGRIELPNYWDILSIHMNEGDHYAIVVIEGPEFPEVPDGEDPKECEILVTKHERYSFEVKQI